uniref:SCP domain-containing protein n=1 Tax=Ascaris lumbricoides TaxID=6252 RepID=A0A0M3HSI6_ASCLU
MINASSFHRYNFESVAIREQSNQSIDGMGIQRSRRSTSANNKQMAVAFLYICLLIVADGVPNADEQRRSVVTVCKEYKDDPAFYDDANPGVRIDYAPRRASTPVQNLLKKWANARTRRRPQLRRHKSLRRSSTHHASRGV